MVITVTVVEAVLVATSTVVVGVVHDPGSGATRFVLITLLSLSMGAQNAVARKLAIPDLTTTVLTLTITGISADSGWAGGGGSKVGRRLVAAFSMFLGALAGALLVLKVSRLAATLTALAILTVVVAVTTALSRHDPDWVRPPS
jgi:uncharacterized membrane protein YoaK (UPF0700 family)